MNQMRELLPCPFCGCSDISGPHYQEYVGDTYSPSWWAECGECPVFVEVEGKDKGALLTAWNMRAQSAAVPVVGDVVAYLAGSALFESHVAAASCVTLSGVPIIPLYHKPTTSITAAELERLQRCEDVLRSLACSLSAGGYNADVVDPAVFEKKIRAGIDMLLAPLTDELDALRKDAERYRNALIVAFQHIDQSTHCKDHALVAAAIAGEKK